MKVIKTTAFGSLVALAGAATLCYQGPLAPQTYFARLANTMENSNQIPGSASLSALGVVAFVLGLLTAVGGIANANRYGGVSPHCRKRVLLAGAAAIAAAGPLLLATAELFLFARALLGSRDPELFVRSHSPTGIGLFYVSFALLAAVAVFLLAASRFGRGEQPPQRLNRWTATGFGLVTITGLAFGEAFRQSCLFAAHCSHQVALSEPRDALIPLYSIATAQLIAGTCLLALGVSITVFGILVRCPGPTTLDSPHEGE